MSDETNFTDVRMTPSSINEEFKRNYNRDPDNYWLWSDISRARFILLREPDKPPVRLLKANNVCSEAIRIVTGQKADETPEKRERRDDKYQKVIDWCMSNHLLQTDAQTVADIGGFSYTTALKFIKDRPDLFYRIKKGLYEARNPQIFKAEENLASGS